MKTPSDKLADFCQMNDNDLTNSVLRKHRDLDLTIDEGRCFWFALHYKNLEMFTSLIDYYEKHQLSGNPHSDPYLKAKYKLKETLDDVVYRIGEEVIPVEIMEIIKPYIEDASDSDIDEDLDQYPDTYDADRDPPLNLALKQYGTHINSETGDCEEGSSDSGGSSEMDSLGAGSYRALLGGGGGFSTSSDEGV